MASKSETSRRRPGWFSRLDTGAKLSPEDIERDAAAQLGMTTDAGAPSVEPHRAPEPVGEEEIHEIQENGPARNTEPKRSRAGGWLRDLVSTEPAAARRERLEAEARAELGLPPEQRAS